MTISLVFLVLSVVSSSHNSCGKFWIYAVDVDEVCCLLVDYVDDFKYEALGFSGRAWNPDYVITVFSTAADEHFDLNSQFSQYTSAAYSVHSSI